MKTRIPNLIIALAVLALSTLNCQFSTVLAQGTAFTYQGQLQNNGSVASGTFNLTFSLYTNSAGGAVVAGPVTNNAVVITNGLFTVLMDFGSSVWNGETNWLQIGVETNGASPFTALAPRQQLTPAPYAIFAESVAASGIVGTLLDTQLLHDAVTVTAGPGFSGGGKVVLGNTIILTNTGVLSVAGNADITATTVGGAVTLGDTATSADTPNLIVKRDGSGDFSANSITLDGTLTLPDVSLTPVVINSGGNLLMNVDSNYDLFLGLYAGPDLGGSGNTGVGYAALNLVSGYNNTAMGFQALYDNNGGSYNSAIGAFALLNNLGGSANTANGYTALYYNTSGSGNTANGCGAMFNNTIGTNNTATGQNALLSNTNGDNNTANGVNALFYNLSGNNNTANGVNALVSNMTGNNNTANASGALQNNTSGSGNTANGYNALVNNTSGSDNVANGRAALFHNTIGDENTADGVQALNANTNGYENTAVGYQALFSNTGGPDNGYVNTAVGYQALYSNSGGVANIALGATAGYNITTGNNNIDIFDLGAASDSGVIRIGTEGEQTKTFIAGISGVTISPTGGPVYINSNGQLGTVNSSRRFKEDIQDMAGQSDILLSLRPVSFHYKPDLDPQRTPQYGLIAEEVEQVAPQLVLRDAKGEVLSVRYEQVNAMLLNEFLKQHRTMEEQSGEIQNLKQQNDSLEKRLNELEKAVARMAENSGAPLALNSRATENK